MPAAGVELQVQLQVDNLDAYRRTIRASIDGRTQLWGLVDDADDEPYENRVKGQSITDLDDVLDEVLFGNNTNIRTWFTLHNSYYNLDAGLEDPPGTPITTLEAALVFYHWRAGQDFAEWFQEALNNTLDVVAVYPSESINLGNYVKSGAVFTDGDAADTTKSGLGMVRAVAAVVIGAAPWTVSAVLTRADDSTVSLDAAFLAADPIGTEIVLGEEALTGDLLTGGTVVSVAATTQFIVGEPVLVVNPGTGDQHYSTVQSIVAATSVTLVDSARFDFTTAGSSTITPLFKDVAGASDGGSGTAGDECDFGFKPDRVTAI